MTAALGEPAVSVEASAVFFANGRPRRATGGSGLHFYKLVEPDVYRLMCSWSVTDENIDDFIRDVKRSRGQIIKPR